MDAPDLSLQGVAFARLADGRIAARGTAERLDYRRSGGRLVASHGAATVLPEPGTGLAELGALRLRAPHIEGEVAARRGTAQGGVQLETGRGDSGWTEAVDYAADTVRSATRVKARGPGYRVEGNGLVARTDGSTIDLIRGVAGQLQVEAR
jgi:hypothetical protein